MDSFCFCSSKSTHLSLRSPNFPKGTSPDTLLKKKRRHMFTFVVPAIPVGQVKQV